MDNCTEHWLLAAAFRQKTFAFWIIWIHSDYMNQILGDLPRLLIKQGVILRGVHLHSWSHQLTKAFYVGFITKL